VVEANLDRGRGPVATLLVQAGTLRRGDILVAGTADGRIRAMFDENGNPVEEAGPARPVQVLGLDEVPEAGDEFRVVDAERFARDVAERRAARERRKELAERRPTTLEEFTSAVEAGGRATLNVIIKADVSGSAEALEDALLKLELEEVQVRVIQKGVGAISQGDVRLAEASSAIIVAFNVRPGPTSARRSRAPASTCGPTGSSTRPSRTSRWRSRGSSPPSSASRCSARRRCESSSVCRASASSPAAWSPRVSCAGRRRSAWCATASCSSRTR
jgi:translation initiation factor IF-2